MATHTIYGNGPTLFQSFSVGSFADKVMYGVATEFGVQNADGTRTYYHGTGFVYDWVNGTITGGTITSVLHYGTIGQPLDMISGLSLSASQFIGVETSPTSSAFLFQLVLYRGDDVIDARNRAGDVVINDTIFAGQGNDRVLGGSGNDKLYGESGNDKLWGGTGSDWLDGGLGNDYLSGSTGNDRLDGWKDSIWKSTFLFPESDFDTLTGGDGTDVLWGRAGTDTLNGGAGTDTAVYFGLFSDLTIVKTVAGFVVTSADGVDTLSGIERIATNEGTYGWSATSNAWSLVSAKSGVATASSSSQVYTGTDGGFLLMVDQNSANYDDRVFDLRGGFDELIFSSGAFGSVVAYGGTGNDRIIVTEIKRLVDGNFYLDGGAEDDFLQGGSMADVLAGGTGNDTLVGGLGDDTLIGGAGADTFVFRPIFLDEKLSQNLIEYEMPGNDVINDFQIGVDSLDLDPTLVTMSNTADGLLLTVGFVSPGGPPGVSIVSYGDRTILLEGVFGNHPIEMLM